MVETIGVAGSLLPGHTGLCRGGALARIGVVPAGAGVCGVRTGHPATLHLQRQTLLVSRVAVWRHSLWALREPQSLRRTDGADHPGRPGCTAAARGQTRPPADGPDSDAVTAGRAVPFRIARRNDRHGAGIRTG